MPETGEPSRTGRRAGGEDRNVAKTRTEQPERTRPITVESLKEFGALSSLSLPAEPFDRTRALPVELCKTLNPTKLEAFIGVRTHRRKDGKRIWEGQRVELDTIPAATFGDWLCSKLDAAGFD